MPHGLIASNIPYGWSTLKQPIRDEAFDHGGAFLGC